jgi:hypothetical protein
VMPGLGICQNKDEDESYDRPSMDSWWVCACDSFLSSLPLPPPPTRVPRPCGHQSAAQHGLDTRRAAAGGPLLLLSY